MVSELVHQGTNTYIEINTMARKMKTLFLFLFTIISLSIPVAAQELECTVTANLDQLNQESRENLVDFVNQVEQYINGYRWTKEDLGGEKIKCALNILFQASPREGRYTVQAFIGSQRQIHKSDRSTAMIRILDDKWEFDYLRNTPLTHNEARFDPLTSFIDYYMYIILGYDFDSYKAGDGTAFFQKAADIVSKARGGGKGWELTSQSSFTRGQFIDELLNPKYRDVREAVEKYHYRGLDLMYKDEEKAKKNILTALEKIGNLQNKVNQRSQIVRIFFDTKYLEIVDLFKDYADPEIYSKLGAIDPSHQLIYEESGKKE